MIDRELLDQFVTVCDALRDSGVNIVACLVRYEPDDAHFSTRLSVTAEPKLGVTEDHILLDAIREISQRWSETVHDVHSGGLER